MRDHIIQSKQFITTMPDIAVTVALNRVRICFMIVLRQSFLSFHMSDSLQVAVGFQLSEVSFCYGSIFKWQIPVLHCTGRVDPYDP